MAYYRSQFPTATVTPKLHMLEEHVVPWIKRWGVGFGVLGEQGKQMMIAQHLKVAPANTTARPPIKRSSLPGIYTAYCVPLPPQYFHLLLPETYPTRLHVCPKIHELQTYLAFKKK